MSRTVAVDSSDLNAVAGAAILGIIALVALAIVLLIAAPFALIWAVNTLFGLSIAYWSFWNWLAGFVLIALFGRGGYSSSKK